jgi:hypothetical protein
MANGQITRLTMHLPKTTLEEREQTRAMSKRWRRNWRKPKPNGFGTDTETARMDAPSRRRPGDGPDAGDDGGLIATFRCAALARGGAFAGERRIVTGGEGGRGKLTSVRVPGRVVRRGRAGLDVGGPHGEHSVAPRWRVAARLR